MSKRILTLFILTTTALCMSVNAYSQKRSMTNHLRSYSDNGSKITIYQDSRLDSLMQKQTYSVTTTEVVHGTMYVTTKGYRIQIFSGNNQRESKAQAQDLADKVKEIFPEMDTYISFNSPFWRLRIGNFRTSEEAYAKLRELKKAFPKWKEMTIVQERVRFSIRK